MCSTDDSHVVAIRQEAASTECGARYQELLNAQDAARPSMQLRPALSIDGNQWCALHGENLQDGVAGFGDSPELAYVDFDKEWAKPLTPREPKVTPKQPDHPRGVCGCPHAYIRVNKDSSSVCDDCGEEFPPIKPREPKVTP